MRLEKNTLKIGLEKPLKILHITDSHVAFADERDSEQTRELVRNRLASTDKEKHLEEQLAYGRENCDLIVHTGDLIDCVSHANFDFARKILSDEKFFFAVGNHEFSHFLGEAYEDRAYKMNSFRLMQPGLGQPLFFSSRVEGGVNFVAIDDSYHQFEPWQKVRLEKEIKKGLPIILCLHAPLFEQSLYDFHISKTGEGVSSYLVGCDEDHMPDDEWRAIEIRPRGITVEMVEFIKSQPMIKAVLAGHVHFDFVSELRPGMPQYVSAGGYDGFTREITII